MSKRRTFTKPEKWQVYAKCNAKCAICGKYLKFSKMTIDHITPLSRGGTNEISNLQAACSTCNKSKGDMTLDEFYQKMITVVFKSKAQIVKRCIAKMLGLNTKEERGVVA